MLKDYSKKVVIQENMADGSGVIIECLPEDVGKIREIMESIYSIYLSTFGTEIVLKNRCLTSRYQLTVHRFKDRPTSFVLEVENPPIDKKPNIIYLENNQETFFSEWNSINEAIKAFETLSVNLLHNEKNLTELPGFIRLVPCFGFTPWFFAAPGNVLATDYAFPNADEVKRRIIDLKNKKVKIEYQ